ncbi:hypothetical protein F4810DRAFT_448028 [Camillea tinctor]|nr:hypothetical protein F4810DRAFT_448028 [Camillea tinctor]
MRLLVADASGLAAASCCCFLLLLTVVKVAVFAQSRTLQVTKTFLDSFIRPCSPSARISCCCILGHTGLVAHTRPLQPTHLSSMPPLPLPLPPPPPSSPPLTTIATYPYHHHHRQSLQ